MLKYLQRFKSNLFWVCLFLLVFIPLYPKFPLFNIKGTFVAIRIEDFLIALTYLLWILNFNTIQKVKEFFNDNLNQTLILFFSIGALSLFSAVFVTQTATLNLGIFHYLRRVEIMMLLPLFASVIQTKKQLIISLLALAGVAFIVTFYALGQQYLNWPVISTTNSEFAKGQILYLTPGARVSSTFAGHYDLAVFLVIVITFIAALFFTLKKSLLMGGAVFLGVLSSLVLVMTAARLSFVAALIGVVASFILTGKKILIIPLIAVAIISLAYPSQLRDRFISTLTINLLESGPRYQAETRQQKERSQLNISTLPHESSTNSAEKVKMPGVPSDITPGEPTDYVQMAVYRSFGIRFDVEWPRAIRAFIKNPLLGSGYSSIGIATDNDFLRILGEIGLLGTISFVFIFIVVIKRLFYVFHSKDKFIKCFLAGTISMVLAFLINGLFIDVFEASKVASLFWMMVGLGLAAEKFKGTDFPDGTA